MFETSAPPAAGRAGVAAPRSTVREAARAWLREHWATASQFLGVTGLAFALYAWGLSNIGYGNTYYAAAVRSMTLSWRNFYFGAFDPGGAITVDKPAGFLWFGALSARIFGYSPWAILLPSAIAGAAGVALLWLIVRRWFGTAAATTAGLVLALSPVTVAIDRINAPDPFMFLALIGAAACIVMSVESKRWIGWTAAAGVLVGLAFNTKNLAAWIPGPALALAILVAMPTISRASIRQVIARGSLLFMATMIVSFAWAVSVDVIPGSERPYVDGSTFNSELNLAFGYNGIGRVSVSDTTDYTVRDQIKATHIMTGLFSPAVTAPPAGSIMDTSRFQTGLTYEASHAAGGIIAGAPGPFRMLDDANGGQIGWLLPFALLAGLISLWLWRKDASRRAFLALFLGWLFLYGVLFSFAQGTFHAYYTSALAPGIAALVGIGAVALYQKARSSLIWLAIACAITLLALATETLIESRTMDFYGWMLPFAIVVTLAGVGLLAIRRVQLSLAMAVTVGGLLLLPGAWSVSEAANAPDNTTLPQAGPRVGASNETFGSQKFDEGTPELAAWLRLHTDSSAPWQIVTMTSMDASTLIAQENISAYAVGGFTGDLAGLSVDKFASLVDAGQLRYVEGRRRPYEPNMGTGKDSRTVVTEADKVLAVTSVSCPPVRDATIPQGYFIYDCTGMGAAIRAAGAPMAPLDPPPVD